MLRTLLVATAVALAASPAAAAAPTLPAVRFDGVPGELAGTAVAPAGDVNGDGAADLIVGAPGAPPVAGDGAGAGAAYVVLGPFAPGSIIDLAGRGFPIRGAAAGARAGTSVAGAGDVNGDGLSDVIVGAPGGDPGQEGPMSRAGQAFVVFGSRAPHAVDLAALGAGGLTLTGESHFFPDAFGWQVAALGDVDRDGLADVGVAAPGNPGFEDDFTRGRAYVVFGRPSPGAVEMARPGRGAFRIGFGTPGEMTSVAAAGDWNRDGRADIAVADGEGLRGAGAVWVVYGRRYRRAIDLARLGRRGLVVRGSPAVHYRFMRASVAGGADVDGDRRPDLVIGAPNAHIPRLGPAAGGAWVVRGTRSRTRVELRRPSARAWEAARGAPGWLSGSSVALGRVNGDRLADIVLNVNGSLAVVFGTRSRRSAQLAALSPDRGFLVDGHIEPLRDPGLAPAGAGGFTTAGVAGDLNGDGRADLLAGARWASHGDRPRAGAAYLFLSP